MSMERRDFLLSLVASVVAAAATLPVGFAPKPFHSRTWTDQDGPLSTSQIQFLRFAVRQDAASLGQIVEWHESQTPGDIKSGVPATFNVNAMIGKA